MKRYLLAVLFFFCLGSSSQAIADDYVIPTETTLIQTLLRFGALDINNDVIIDDYAKIVECDLFSTFKQDDFKWNKIREGLRNKIRSEAVTYPANFYVKGYISLDRYDFNTRTFRISPSAPLIGVNAFRLMDSQGNQCNAFVKALPTSYVASLEGRISIPGFIMSEGDAQSLLARLNRSGNTTRQIVAKSHLKITGVPKVSIDFANINLWYDATTYVGKRRQIIMDAKLDSVEFYEDQEMRRRIFVYRP
jgi:hypothetical protein